MWATSPEIVESQGETTATRNQGEAPDRETGNPRGSEGTTVATMELLPDEQVQGQVQGQVEEQQDVPDGLQDRLWAMVEAN